MFKAMGNLTLFVILLYVQKAVAGWFIEVDADAFVAGVIAGVIAYGVADVVFPMGRCR